jgi:hypothetical protein
MKRGIFVSLSLVLAISGCGGGGGGDVAPSTTAEGLWVGSTNNGRTIAGIVLDDGTYWVLYSLIGNSAVIAGAVQGSGTSQNGSFTSTNGKDFNLEGLGINDVTVNASYVMKQSFNGTVRYTATGDQVTFTSSYDTNYDLTPSLNIIAGTYSGTAATTGGMEFATVTVSSSGALTGSSASGCNFSGTVSPRARGNVYNVSVTFGGGVCANGTSTVDGIAYYDAATKQLYSAALNSPRSNGFIYVGTKP